MQISVRKQVHSLFFCICLKNVPLQQKNTGNGISCHHHAKNSPNGFPQHLTDNSDFPIVAYKVQYTLAPIIFLFSATITFPIVKHILISVSSTCHTYSHLQVFDLTIQSTSNTIQPDLHITSCFLLSRHQVKFLNFSLFKYQRNCI